MTYKKTGTCFSPAEELEFCTADESRDSLDIISLTNTTEKHVAYKVSSVSLSSIRSREIYTDHRSFGTVFPLYIKYKCIFYIS